MNQRRITFKKYIITVAIACAVFVGGALLYWHSQPVRIHLIENVHMFLNENDLDVCTLDKDSISGLNKLLKDIDPKAVPDMDYEFLDANADRVVSIFYLRSTFSLYWHYIDLYKMTGSDGGYFLTKHSYEAASSKFPTGKGMMCYKVSPGQAESIIEYCKELHVNKPALD